MTYECPTPGIMTRDDDHSLARTIVKTVIRLGARRSALSLWQAQHVAGLIEARHPSLGVEIQPFKTLSDRNPEAPLRSLGRHGVFTDALEAALLAREIDAAAHSLKDLPVEMPPGLALAAVTERGDHRDALVSRNGLGLSQLPEGARVGTSSLRRRAQLLALRPDLKIEPIRGNVPTRLEKLRADGGAYDAIVLAAAGLNRLGLSAQISEIFDDLQMLGAAGQGAIALQCRAEADELRFFQPLADRQTAQATAAERAFLHALDAGCSLPVAAYGYVQGGRLILLGRVTTLEGARQIDVIGEANVTDETASR